MWRYDEPSVEASQEADEVKAAREARAEVPAEIVEFTPQEIAADAQPVPAAVDLERIRIAVERTELPFTHLYAALEWQLQELYEATLAEQIESRGGKVARGSLALETPSVFGVTSAVAGEGKTAVALRLALTIARNTHKKVCLIDLGLSGDVICRRLGVTSEHGMTEILEGDAFAIRTVQFDPKNGDLSIMPAGSTPNNPTRAARSPRVAEVIAAARQMFDIVIVDMPAVYSGNALPIAACVDKVLMVVRAGVTPHEIVKGAIERVGRTRTLGVVLNRIRPSAPQWLLRRFGFGAEGAKGKARRG